MNNITLTDIETAAKKLRAERDAVAAVVTDLETQMAQLHAAARRRLNAAISRTAIEHAELFSLINLSRELFTKPRTYTFHGIRCGLSKGKGKIEFQDEPRVIAAIEKKLPDLSEVLVEVKKSVVKEALKKLTVEQLKSIGCTVEETDDHVVIAYTDKAIDKAVKSLLKAATQEAINEAEAA